ncbi:asparaginase-domain-containing protein [Lichtheimia hyalospora FSU 10163]|nr:asparaginase-domain-containing protein [Lichtheimia hyalospora FSU 10163]
MLSPPSSAPRRPIFDNAAVVHQLTADRNEMLVPDFSRVLCIYTGGTIGMKHTKEHGYIPLPNYFAQTLGKNLQFHDPFHNPNSRSSTPDSGRSSRSSSPTRSNSPTRSSSPTMMDNGHRYAFGSVTNSVRTMDEQGVETKQELPSLITPISLYGKRIRYSILEYDPLLDSCNMTMEDWVRIAKDIEANYEHFDAFIVLHGTDTMAYTASALSFLLEDLGKTVIITGSQVPLTEVRNDALDNLLGALTIAGHFLIPEVCLYFRQKLYRGNRSSKLSAVDFDAFDSPNMPCLVEVGIDINVRWPLVLRPTRIAKLHSHKKLNPNVASLRLFPGINETTVRTFLAPPIQGVVLETYGAGNAPARADLLSALKEACDRGVVIVNCTQCRKGLVTSSYATGRQLAAIGVVAGADMTPECALTKLSYLLGKRPDDPHYVREMMMRNIRGELTVQQQQQQFSAFNRTHALIDMMVSMSAHAKNTSKSEWDGVLDHDLTMPVEEQLVAEKALLPVILCSAAMANDLDGLRKLYDSHISDMINLNTVDYDGRSPLHLACREGHVDVVEFLLLRGASIHIRDRQGHSPLFVALVEKRAQVVDMLRRAGAHLSEKEYPDMGTIWLKAVAKGDTRFVQLALSAGWSVNWAEPVDGRRAIHVAVCQGRVSVLKCLLAQPNLDLSRKDRWGFSVKDTVEWVKNAQGVSAIDEIANLVEQHMQRLEKQ